MPESLDYSALYDRLPGQRADFDAPEVERCATQVDRAFSAALDELQALQGSDVAAWRLGSGAAPTCLVIQPARP